MAKKAQIKEQTEEEKQLHHEHDKAFKVAMQNKETALEYVEKYVKDVHIFCTVFTTIGVYHCHLETGFIQ